MKLGKHLTWTLVCALPLALGGCSSGGGGGASVTVSGVVQNLTVDPDGKTVVVSFSEAPAGLATTNFEADGGQVAQSVSVSGANATVVFDERVTPAHQVRVVGHASLAPSWTTVTTTDLRAVTFTVTDAQQLSGLGGDTIEVVFAGPRVVESVAEDISSWQLRVGGQVMDLTGSVLTLDVAAQRLAFVLGPDANLHNSFTLEVFNLTSVADVPIIGGAHVGIATGDLTSPTLVSAEQNLGQDEFGGVVDFTFSEAMDPVFSTFVTSFQPSTAVIATGVTQPSDEVLRVTFSGPVIPGRDTVTLTSIVDSHGNSFAGGAQAITQSAPVANAYTSAPEVVTVSDAGGDYVEVITDQAFDATEAEDPSNWTLTIDGSNVDLSTEATLSYDLPNKTLRIDLTNDYKNGDAFSLTPSAILEVDGQTFSTAAGGTVAGDATEVTVASAVQNRTQASNGTVVDVTVNEDLETAPAENLANWSISGGLSVTSASLLGNLSVVRLTLDGAAVPGDYTIGAQNLEDLAGNVMSAPETGIAITSTDSDAPAVLSVTAEAIEGAGNDVLVVQFDDDMVEAEVEDTDNWDLESPVATSLDLTGATIEYDSVQDTATVTLTTATGVNLKRGDDFELVLTAMRDIGGNAIGATPGTGLVDFERTLPTADAAWRDATLTNRVVVRFSEPCDLLDDLYDSGTNPTGTRYVVRDSGGVLRGYPTSGTALDDGLGVELTFGFVVNTSDTLDVMGATDLAGNYMFPVELLPIDAEDGAEPAHDVVASPLVSVSGESNDVVTVRFDRTMSPWNLLDPANYTLDGTVDPVLTGAEFHFDGDRTVTIDLNSSSADSLQSADTYDIVVDNVQTAQGVVLSSPITESGVAVSGDVTGPTVAVSDVRVDPSTANSLIVLCDEALDQAAAQVATNYDLNSGNIATSALRLGQRAVRVTFAVQPAPGDTLDFSVSDLAGNSSGAISRTVGASDTSPPLLNSVSGLAVANTGGDQVLVQFDEPVSPATALDLSNYTITNGSVLSLSGARAIYDSTQNLLRVRLGQGVELDPLQSLSVAVADVEDHAGNAMSSTPTVLGGTIGGDVTAPTIASAFANYREDSGGYTVDVLFSEDVDPVFASDIFNWSGSGGQTVIDVQQIEPNYFQVLSIQTFGIGETLDLAAGLPDLAGNTAGAISVAPIL